MDTFVVTIHVPILRHNGALVTILTPSGIIHKREVTALYLRDHELDRNYVEDMLMNAFPGRAGMHGSRMVHHTDVTQGSVTVYEVDYDTLSHNVAKQHLNRG